MYPPEPRSDRAPSFGELSARKFDFGPESRRRSKFRSSSSRRGGRQLEGRDALLHRLLFLLPPRVHPVGDGLRRAASPGARAMGAGPRLPGGGAPSRRPHEGGRVWGTLSRSEGRHPSLELGIRTAVTGPPHGASSVWRGGAGVTRGLSDEKVDMGTGHGDHVFGVCPCATCWSQPAAKVPGRSLLVSSPRRPVGWRRRGRTAFRDCTHPRAALQPSLSSLQVQSFRVQMVFSTLESRAAVGDGDRVLALRT